MTVTPVQRELRKIAEDYRRFRLFRSLSAGWIFLGLAALVALIVTQALARGIQVLVPALAGLAFVFAVFAWAKTRTIKFGLSDIARQVEQDDPRLNSLLLAAVEQTPDAASGKLNFLQERVIKEALEANRRSPWAQRFAERLFFAQVAHFGAFAFFLVALVAFALTQPAKPLRVQLVSPSLEISPGNAEVERGRSVPVLARFGNRNVPASARLVMKSIGGVEKTIELQKSLDDPLFGTTLPEVKESLTYYIAYGSNRSQEFRIKVFDYPELQRADVELTFPHYTRLAPKQIDDTRRVTAVQETKVHYTLHLNKPVKSATLVSKDGQSLSLTNTAEAVCDLNLELVESRNYHLRLVDTEGRTNRFPPEFSFVALTNQSPKLKFILPRGDQRVSALQEMQFQGETEDDFGLEAYGIGYSKAGEDATYLTLSTANATNTGLQQFSHLLPLESLNVEVGDLISYFLWADDFASDGKVRRSVSEMFFAEVRPFDEIFRQGQGDSSSSSQQSGGGQQTPTQKLAELQKEIISATWNLQRQHKGTKPAEPFKKDAEVIEESQSTALEQALEMKEQMQDERFFALGERVESEMKRALSHLGDASGKGDTEALSPALAAEQAAYQALLQLQGREYQVARSRNRSGGRQGGQQRAQRQLDQLELNEDENRYERESEAAAAPTTEERETLQVLNRLKELARRQQDMSERLKELQAALNEAKTEEERENLERQLKRLQEEQQQIVEDMDELRQRMSTQENQSRLADERQQLDRTRQQSRNAAEEMREGDVGQALSSSTRAQRQLQDMSEELRKKTTRQFTEEMRKLRQEARDLEERQSKIAEKFQQLDQTQQRTLSDSGPKKEILDQLAEQRSGLTNLLQEVRDVTEKAETAEPLLSRQLYETFRKTAQTSPEKSLELAGQALERNFLPDAAQLEQRARQGITELKTGIERAARNVLGDDAEALRLARRELEDLTRQVEQELTRNTHDPNSTNTLAAAGSRPQEANGQTSDGGSRESRSQENSQGAQAGEQREGQAPGNGERQDQQNANQTGRSSNSQSQEGQRSGEQNGSQPGGQQGAQNPGNSNQPGQQPGQQRGGSQDGNASGQQPQDQASRAANTPEGSRQPGNRNQAGNQGGSRGGNFFDNWNTGANTGGGGFEGPLTGQDYSRWADRLRDVEEMLGEPGLRADVARVLDQARSMRAEFKRHSTVPQWDLVQEHIINPMRILQHRVAEELAKRASREAVVPIDRDPVPAKFSELVNRYYEKLGKGE